MLLVSILQSNETNWWIRLKDKTQPFVAYKKCTSLAKINIDLEQKDGKKI
jgi:hypothetical protein